MTDINSDAYLGHLLGEDEYNNLQSTILSQVASAISSIGCIAVFGAGNADGETSSYSGQSAGAHNKKRKRKDMEEYIVEMDATVFRRKYRMDKLSFFKLLDILGYHMPSTSEKASSGSGSKRTYH